MDSNQSGEGSFWGYFRGKLIMASELNNNFLVRRSYSVYISRSNTTSQGVNNEIYLQYSEIGCAFFKSNIGFTFLIFLRTLLFISDQADPSGNFGQDFCYQEFF